MKRIALERAAARTLALFAACVSCSESSGPEFRGPEIMAIEVEAGSDTIESPHTRLVTVTVTDSTGRPGVGLGVHVTAPKIDDVQVLTLNSAPNLATITAGTDDSGRALFTIQSRLKAGTVQLRIRVINSDLVDSVPITVLAGNPHNILFEPADTALLVGGQYPLAINVQDRWFNVNTIAPRTIQNLREDVVTFTSGQISAIGQGRGTIRVTSGDVTREGHVSVVPPGEFIAYMDVGLPAAGFYRVRTDGSSLSKVLTTTGGAPRWSPVGDRVAYHGDGRIHRTDLQGNVTRIIPHDYGAVSEIQPQYSRDGAWVFFIAQPGSDRFEVWRVAANGSAPTRVGPVAADYNHDTSPSPSPDGARVVFATNRVLAEQGLVLQVLTVANGTVSPINIPGRLPRWAPSGERIAYLNGNNVGIVNADGTNNRVFTGSFIDDAGSVDWSPDGQWLVSCAGTNVSGQRLLVILNAATGEQLPLEWSRTRYLCASSWRP
jgi:Tol biopolymer transport system component